MSKRLVVMLTVVVAVVLGGAVAFAQTGSGSTTLSGKGALNASGSGSVDLTMEGTLRMAADGDVLIVDHAGDAQVVIVVPGDETESARAGEPTYDLDGFQGIVRIQGSDFSVEVEGFSAFKARGSGTAVLTGDGIWKTRNASGFWSENGTELGLNE